jgi:hypothetical protein
MKGLKMNTEKHEITFIIFNRDEMKGEFDRLYGGPWHWGVEDDDGTFRVSHCGWETAQDAMRMMNICVKAIYDDGGTEYLDRQLRSLPEGTAIDSITRMTCYCPPPIHDDDYRRSPSYERDKREFVAAALKEFGLSK